MNKKGFTILEILVVLSVIAILIGIAVPRLKGMQDQANISKAKAELRALQAAIVSYYTNTSPNAYPPTSTTVAASYLISATPQIIASPLYDPFRTPPAEYLYVLSGNGMYYFILSTGPNGVNNCFTSGTKVLLADGSTKNIENLQVGDLLLGSRGTHNTVVKIDVRPRQDRKIFSLNEGRYFVTEDHPIMTKGGWKALNSKIAQQEHPEVKVGQLKIGDELVTHTGFVRLEKIRFKILRDAVVYNQQLNSSHDYYADGFLVHNRVVPSIDDSGVVSISGDDICVTNGTGC